MTIKAHSLFIFHIFVFYLYNTYNLYLNPKTIKMKIKPLTLSLGIAFVILLSILYTRKNNPSQHIIETQIPPRIKNQKDALLMVAPKIDTVKVGFIGLGMRGPGAVKRFTHIPGTRTVALCDLSTSNVDRCQKILIDAGKPKAAVYSENKTAWKKLCQRKDIDLVYIATDWKSHAEMGIYAMKQGKHVAIEVPAAMTLKEIWQLIDTSEKTRKHCIQLENCVYDFFELTTLNMAQHHLFGEILHTEGAYIHNLENFWSAYWNNWRMDYNQHHRGDVYPTHGLGPACQLLNIHRGDKLDFLVSMDTKAVNGPAYLKKTTGKTVKNFQNGDQTSTLIRTQKGKTILIQHNVMTPRPYNRMYQIVGTEGYASKYPIEEYCFRPNQIDSKIKVNHENLTAHGAISKKIKDTLMLQYKHPIQKELEKIAKKIGGHGGMDYIMDYRLVYCLRNGLPLDMDVYDLAEWCCLPELTRISIENGSMPVKIPDFTRGGWDKIKGYQHFYTPKK